MVCRDNSWTIVDSKFENAYFLYLVSHYRLHETCVCSFADLDDIIFINCEFFLNYSCLDIGS